MFENLKNIFKKNRKKELVKSSSKDTAKERLHLVLMQDRANVSADFLDLMRKEIIEVIKKYIDIDEKAIDVRLTTETTEDGTQSAPALYANIPIINIKDEARKFGNEEKENREQGEVKNTETDEENNNKKNLQEKKEEDNKNQETTEEEINGSSDKEIEQDEKEDKSRNQEQSEEKRNNDDIEENQDKQSTEKKNDDEENHIEEENKNEK